MRVLGLAVLLAFAVVATDTAWADDGDPLPAPPPDTTLRRNDAAFTTCVRPCCCQRDQRCGWTLSAGGLYMTRSDPEDETLLDDGQGNDVLSGGDFELGYEPGFEISLTKHRLFGCVDLEARFFALSEWSDSFSSNPGGIDTFIPTTPAFLIPTVGLLESEFESELRSIELNARWRFACLPKIRWLAGLRAMRFGEEIETTVRGGAAAPVAWEYDIETENLLYGVQVGLDWDVLSSQCFCLKLFGRGGIFLNQAEQEFRVSELGDPIIDIEDDESTTSPFVEAGVSAVWCFSRNFALRADYRFLWIDGLALAPNQVGAVNLANSNGIDTDGSVLFHGFYLGLDWSF